jgi:hypothetical protein
MRHGRVNDHTVCFACVDQPVNPTWPWLMTDAAVVSSPIAARLLAVTVRATVCCCQLVRLTNRRIPFSSNPMFPSSAVAIADSNARGSVPASIPGTTCSVFSDGSNTACGTNGYDGVGDTSLVTCSASTVVLVPTPLNFDNRNCVQFSDRAAIPVVIAVKGWTVPSSCALNVQLALPVAHASVNAK